MSIILCLVLILATTLCRLKEKNIYNPGVLFNAYWLVIVFLSVLNIYGLREVDPFVYKMILLGVLSFNCACLIPRLKFSSNPGSRVYLGNKVVINAMFVAALLFLAIVDIVALILIFRGASISAIRFSLRDIVFASYYMNLLFKFFVYPFVVTNVVYFFAGVLANKRIIVMDMVKAMLLTVMDYLANGDRIIIYIWLIGILMAWGVLKKGFTSLKGYRKIKRASLVILAIAALMVIGRKNVAYTIAYSAVTYFTGGLIYFSRALNRINLTAGQTIFVTSYQGFFRPIMGVLELVGIKWRLFEEATEFMLTNQFNSYSLDYTAKSYLNYFTTCFGYFYYDFKTIGVLVHSFIFGLCAKQTYYNLKDDGIRSVGVYMFWVICIFLGMMNFAMAETSVSLGLVYFLLCFQRSGKITGGKNKGYKDEAEINDV